LITNKGGCCRLKKSHKKLVFFLAIFSFQASKKKLFGTSMPNYYRNGKFSPFFLCKQASEQASRKQRKKECYVENPCHISDKLIQK